jgi:hypothetical protein
MAMETEQQNLPATPGGAPSLHRHALEAERSLEQLATGLGQAGVADDVVGTVSQMADMVRQLAMALGEGQEQTGDMEPPADEAVVQAEARSPRTIQSAAQGLMSDMQLQRQRTDNT